MDYSLITEQAINNRYNTVPDELREAVDSEQTKKILSNISKTQYLDENKSLMLEQLVALVLLGFMSTSELVHELREQLFLNHEHARVLASELNNRIFESLKEELVASYNPPGGVSDQKEEAAETAKAAEEPLPMSSFKVVAEETAIPAPAVIPVAVDVKEGGPAVLQKETSFFERAELKSTGKRPSLSFNTFASSSENAEQPRVQAKIETPLGVQWAPKKEEPKEMRKVVHYNEFRSSIDTKPSAPVSEFINLGALKKVSFETKPVPVAPQRPSGSEGVPKPAGVVQPAAPSAPMPIVAPTMPEVPTLITPIATIKPAVAPTEEKKSPLMWSMAPISVSTPTASAPIKPEPRRIDAVVVNTTPAPVQKIMTPAPIAPHNAQQPALEGNIIHLR